MTQPALHVPALDATKLLPRLYQGGVPASADAVRLNGFDVLVLCAREIQPPDSALVARYGKLTVLRCPLDDNGLDMSSNEERMAMHVGREVARRVSAGQACITTCAQGRNRSGLVNAIAIFLLMRNKTGEQVVQYIQSRRANALTNPAFVRFIERLR